VQRSPDTTKHGEHFAKAAIVITWSAANTHCIQLKIRTKSFVCDSFGGARCVWMHYQETLTSERRILIG
jgi:hypothetical protein